MVRFETNRALTGMGHERYGAGDEIRGNRPPDELARRLLAHDSVDGVHINGSVVTVDLDKGYTSEGLKEIIEDLYIFYPEPAEEDAGAVEPHDGEADLADAAAAEMAAEPGPWPTRTPTTCRSRSTSPPSRPRRRPRPRPRRPPRPRSRRRRTSTADEVPADRRRPERRRGGRGR